MQNMKVYGYTLLHQLGMGGMAEVWYAENEIGKKAAVKVLLPKFCADEAIVARFQNEAKVMVQLDHPNIRQAYDYATIDGRPCMVMEYLEGDDLSKRMKRGERFSDDQLKKWWNQIADALNYTHAQGVVHRDIKPSNIFVDKKDNVKLLDFGIAKLKESISMTQTGAMMGTLMYMSPEQVMDAKHIDAKTDLYSIAVTFVHLLRGKAPYDTTTSNDYEIRKNIVEVPLDMTGIPYEWQNFLRPYLAKKPEERPALTVFCTVEDAPTVLQATPISPAVAEETVAADETIYGAGFRDRSVCLDDIDPYFMDAATLVVETQMASTSLIQRRLRIGYYRAGRIMDQLEEFKIVGPSKGSKVREVRVRSNEELRTIFQNMGLIDAKEEQNHADSAVAEETEWDGGVPFEFAQDEGTVAVAEETERDAALADLADLYVYAQDEGTVAETPEVKPGVEVGANVPAPASSEKSRKRKVWPWIKIIAACIFAVIVWFGIPMRGSALIRLLIIIAVLIIVIVVNIKKINSR